MRRISTPRVSVIIPTFNYGCFLPEAIQSVLRQEVDDLELIVVDDGSTDGTQDVLRRQSVPGLRVIRTENRGIGAARNTGLLEARGAAIAFLDADDRWLPGKLQRQLAILEAESQVGLVFTDFVRFDDQKVYPQTQFDFFPEMPRLPTVAAPSGGRRILGPAFESLIAFGEFPSWLQTIVLRRGAIHNVRFPEDGIRIGKLRGAVLEDLDFCARIWRTTGVAYIPEPLVEVRRHGANVTDRFEELAFSKLATLERLEEEKLTISEWRALRKRVGRQWVNVGRIHARRGELVDAVHALGRAIRYGRRLSAAKALALYIADLLRSRTTG